MILIRNIFKSFNERKVLEDVSFSIERGQRAALVGPNGIGKTTLLRIIAKEEEPTKGTVEPNPNTRIGYLAQETIAEGDTTIKAYVDERAGFDVPVYKIETMLHGFQMQHLTVDVSITNLSGGQKRKVALIGLFLSEPDLFLLDEPTNNLDIMSVIWLETYLRKKDLTAIIVSHDRVFLDRVTDRVLALDPRDHTLMLTRGTYSNYLIQEKKREKRERLEYVLQQHEIVRLEKVAQAKKEAAAKGAKWQPNDNDKMLRGFKQNRAKKSARVAQVVIGRINRMDKLPEPLEKTPLAIPLESEKEKGVADIVVRNVSFVYDSFTLEDILLDIPYGSRVALLGHNGSGKTTLLRLISGMLEPTQGAIEKGSGVRIGNLTQEHEQLPREKTVIAYMKEHAGYNDHQIYNILQKFGIDNMHAQGRIKDMSTGMRTRLLLALFATQSVNVLILDEPTNHLDIEGVEALEELLATYEGTVVMVSHDRKLLEHAKLERVYVMDEGHMSKIASYTEYIEESETKAEKLIRMI